MLWCDTGILRIGSFHALPEDPRFAAAGQIDRHEFVFPRTPVWIQPAHDRGFLADASTVVFYNPDQPYTRRGIVAAGDRCDWFGIDDAVLGEILATLDPAAADRPELGFAFTHGPSDATSYRRQRLAIQHASCGDPPDALYLEELMIGVLTDVLCLEYAAANRTAPPPRPARQVAARELTERARLLLAERFADPIGLGTIARAVGSSPCHLCRVFHSTTGMTLHRHRTELRLRASLDLVADPRSDLATIAVDLGFANHSHFSAAFRRIFGQTPSAFRALAFRGGGPRRRPCSRAASTRTDFD